MLLRASPSLKMYSPSCSYMATPCAGTHKCLGAQHTCSTTWPTPSTSKPELCLWWPLRFVMHHYSFSGHLGSTCSRVQNNGTQSSIGREYVCDSTHNCRVHTTISRPQPPGPTSPHHDCCIIIVSIAAVIKLGVSARHRHNHSRMNMLIL